MSVLAEKSNIVHINVAVEVEEDEHHAEEEAEVLARFRSPPYRELVDLWMGQEAVHIDLVAEPEVAALC